MLAQQGEAGIPGAVAAVKLPAPVGMEGQQHAYGCAQGPAQVYGGVVHRDNSVACADQGGQAVDVVEEIHAGALNGAWVGGIVRVDFGLDVSILQVDQSDVLALESGDQGAQGEAALGAGFEAAAAPGDAIQPGAWGMQCGAQLGAACGVGVQVGVRCACEGRGVRAQLLAEAADGQLREIGRAHV